MFLDIHFIDICGLAQKREVLVKDLNSSLTFLVVHKTLTNTSSKKTYFVVFSSLREDCVSFYGCFIYQWIGSICNLCIPLWLCDSE